MLRVKNMDLGDIGWIGFIILVVLDVFGWWATLLLWVIPTLSIGLADILNLTVWTIVGVGLFFTVWLLLMVVGVVILAGILFA